MGCDTMLHFLYLGNLLVEKGPLLLLDACEILQAKGLPFHCHIVGAPTSEISIEDLQQRLAAKGIYENVTIHGARYGHDKEQLLQKADVMVFPTFYHNECFPLVLLEGMKHMQALISTKEGAIPDIIQHGTTGLLVEQQNTQALADAMHQLIEAPDKAKQMGQAAHARYLSHFTEVSFIECLAGILRNA